MSDLKQVILVRTDLKMSKGKIAAQVAHGAVDATLNCNKKLVSKWRETGMRKITLRVENEVELFKYYHLAIENDLTTSLIVDAGHTEIAPNSKTVVAIGPGPCIKIDKICGELKPL